MVAPGSSRAWVATLSEAPRGAEHADEDEVPSKAAYCRDVAKAIEAAHESLSENIRRDYKVFGA